MSQTTTERVGRTAITVVSRLQNQLEEAFGQLQEIAPAGQGMTFKHPDGMDKPEHFAVFQRQSGDTLKLIGVYPGAYPAEAIQAAGKTSDVVIVSTRSLWQPVSG